MKALFFDGSLAYRDNYAEPHFRPGYAIIAVKLAGICNTDIELTRGYMNFSGILGHEFTGIVVDCEDHSWHGKRVVGEINVGCGKCDWCLKGLSRHCPYRSVLGISHHDGCMAEYCMLPVGNLIEVPASMSDEEAVFTEPVSAACEILEQVDLTGGEEVVILGDGKLGILCAWVLSTVTPNVTLVGHHEEKLAIAEWNGIQTVTSLEPSYRSADIVVDATGSADGLQQALRACQPRGTLVLKSTIAKRYEIDLAPAVINEIRILGSRCGRFKDGVEMISTHKLPVDRLISSRYPLEESEQAFAKAQEANTLKVLLQVTQTPV